MQRPGQPAAGRPGHREAVLEVEGEGPAIGDQHGVRQRPVPVRMEPVAVHGGTLPRVASVHTYLTR